LLSIPRIPDVNIRRDPNGFYYKPQRSMIPGAEFSLECEQWRHGVEPESFRGEIHFDTDGAEIAGALECRIHAENLSDLTTVVVPVRINVRRVRSYDAAKNLVDFLVTRPLGLKLGGHKPG
jgi:hypothetical protein